ncbi:MAG: DUF1805 domain-containing protein [Candidatus Thermoplasmatota archaeon]|nr:DUF1805 domain-containing protein [Candidatus Thermoplasmatota archaeon]
MSSLEDFMAMQKNDRYPVRGPPPVTVHTIALENGPVTGIRVKMGKAPLLLLAAPGGYVMCGYLNMDTANRLGDLAALVTGVSDFDQMLDAPLAAVSHPGQGIGKPGMTAREFLNRLLEESHG